MIRLKSRGELVIVDSSADKMYVNRNFDEGGVLFETSTRTNIDNIVEVTEAELPELISFLQSCLKG